MQAVKSVPVKGAKAGEKKQRQPYVARDSLQSVAYAKILYLLGEGEIEGLADGLRSVKLNDTPLLSENGTYNFQDVTFDFRNGTVEQSFIEGFPEVSNETSVNVELRSDIDWVKAIQNTDLNAVRVRLSWPSLQEATSRGDILGYTIRYAIDLSTDDGAYQTVLNTEVSGKTSNTYQRTHRIELPKANKGWQVRVRRLTANKNSTLIADTMYVEAITNIIDAKLRYPNTAIAAIKFNAIQFNNIPKFSVIVKGKKLKVPSNYDPETRTYTGIWDGTFKVAYSNNPAWIWYDLLINPRYGLGNRIDATMINKAALYRISQYCDQMVSNGKGGLEPRFTCNVCIQSQQEAYAVLNDLASVFHGMSYWDGAQMVCISDMPSDPVYIFSRANIVDGMVNYTGTSRKDRHSIAQVAWDDPNNNYQTKKEPVWKENSVKTLGIQTLEVSSFGCTSQGQAIRHGKWALETEQKETRTATFRVGLDGSIPKPGEIIKLSDPLLAGRDNGGRITEVAKNQLTTDRLSVIRKGDTLTVNLPSGNAESKIVKQVKGKLITVSSNFSEIPEEEAVWAVDSEDLSTIYMRVIAITRPNIHQFEITAVQHSPDKYNAIDTSAIIDNSPITIIPPSVQQPPSNVRLTQSVAIEQGIAVTTMTIAWDAAPNAISYRVEWRRNNLQWIVEPNTGSLSIDIKGIYAGEYIARVYAINAINAVSIPTSSNLTRLEGKTGAPPVPAFLTTESIIFGITLKWGFPLGADDTQRTEIEYSQTADGQNAMKLGDFAYPQSSHTMQGLAAGQRFWFRSRLVDRTGNIGAWTKWIAGISSNDASDILGMISEKITESHLAKTLMDKINSGGGASTEIKEVRDKLAAMITLKTQLTADGKEYLAGIGVGVENHDGITQSQVLIAADRFAVIHPNGTETSIPFIIENNNIYIQTALIKDGTITNAKIADSLQSTNFVDGVSGWEFNKNGRLQINGSGDREARVSLNNKGMIIYDENGNLIVEVGVDL